MAVVVSQLFDLQQQRLMADIYLEGEEQQQQPAEQQQERQQTAQPAAQQMQQQAPAGSLLTGSLFESGETGAALWCAHCA